VTQGVHYIEPFAGSATVAYALYGARRLTPYMGSKLSYARQLLDLMQLTPETVDQVDLMDSGEWGSTLEALHDFGQAERVADILGAWGADRKAALDAGEDVRYWTDDRELYDKLMQHPIVGTSSWRAASHLFLQTRSFNGKPVSAKNGRWKGHGFDPEYRDNKKVTSAKTNNRGWATPRWKLAERIRKNATLLPTEGFSAQVWDHGISRCPLLWDEPVTGPRVVYMDPPYQGVTKYPDSFDRAAVLAMARGLYERGNTSVYVSEAEPLGELVAEGWSVVPLLGSAKRAWKASTVKEWVTFRRAVSVWGLLL
jgi:hypothetical protein